MALGATQIGQIVQSDSVELVAFMYINDQVVTQDQILRVDFTVQLPDETKQGPISTPPQSDGSGSYHWTNTSQLGEYVAKAQFVLGTGEIRSAMLTFTVIDPFNPPAPSPTDLIVDAVQIRLEDCFDSAEGGPWLREQSFKHFDYYKIADFIPEALLDINVQMPPTNYDLGTFADQSTNPNMPLLVKGVLCLTIRHLMRSYVEQPTPAGGQVIWHDRTRYQQLWSQIYQVEYADWLEKVRLSKRTELRLGHAASLQLSKAGRLYPYGSMRARGIWRGYY